MHEPQPVHLSRSMIAPPSMKDMASEGQTPMQSWQPLQEDLMM